ncbi:MAG: hypothetical protein ACE5IP_00930 [Terriglobia bacterium]
MSHTQPKQLAAGDSPTRRAAGFTLVETLLAVMVFTVGILAIVPLVLLGARQGELSRYQTAATTVAERQLERILQNEPAAGLGFFDPEGNWVQVSCADPAQPSCGNPLNASGLINFSASGPAGFSLSYADPEGVAYDVRWNIQQTPNSTRKIVVGVRAQPGILPAPPVHLRTLIAQ